MEIRQSLPIITALSIIGIIALTIYVINQSNEISTFTERKYELETSKIDLMETISKLEDEMILTNSNIEILESQIIDLEKELQEKNIETLNKDQILTSLQSELIDAKKEAAELITQIQDLLKQIESLSVPNDQRHLDPSIMAAINCSDCHTEVVRQSLARESNSYHNTHFNNILLNFNCVDCHKSVDILSESTDINRVIDNKTCIKCHTSYPDKKWMTFTSTPTQFAKLFPSCEGCHSDWKKTMQEATYVNLDNITNNDCTSCHLNNVLFPVKKEPIGPIACTKCH